MPSDQYIGTEADMKGAFEDGFTRMLGALTNTERTTASRWLANAEGFIHEYDGTNYEFIRGCIAACHIHLDALDERIADRG